MTPTTRLDRMRAQLDRTGQERCHQPRTVVDLPWPRPSTSSTGLRLLVSMRLATDSAIRALRAPSTRAGLPL